MPETPIQYLKGIGPKRAKAFQKAGIRSVEDLLYYFPRRYEDRTNLSSVDGLKEGELQTIKAKVFLKSERRSWRRRGFSILEVAVGDETGKIYCVWFNQPYLKDYFEPGAAVILTGKVERYGLRLQMNSPEFEMISEEGDSLDLGRLVPVYTLPEGLTQRHLRRLIRGALDEYLLKAQDCLPYEVRSRNNLINLPQSLRNIHFPETPELRNEAYERLAFEEFFIFQLPLALRKIRKKEKRGIAHAVDGEMTRLFREALPFKLTQSQEKVLEEIRSDMGRPQAMQRLLQGDVGSGKTVVATCACLMAIQGDYQATVMVPTEILAKQHFEKISFQLSAVSCRQKKIKVGLLISGLKKKEKDKTLKEIREGNIDLVIGTHALLEEDVKFKNLGLVVIDEQHKFGVGQRALLPKKGANPDVLIMTATPIPRTLAITLYGDLDISVISELPPGRKPVKTLHFKEEDRPKAYGLAKQEILLGRQAYIIYPVIEESYALDISGAKRMYGQLKTGYFKEFSVGLIHGRLKQEEQDRVMTDFKEKKVDVLVSTTVLEVGIDVSSATCMIVEHAERFGLSQLHQLRGRIGRGSEESVFLLISDLETEGAEARITALARYKDGFRIAEEDLKIRGPGEFFGFRQHGLTELKIANPLSQLHLLKRAREEAIKLVSVDSRLESRQHQALRQKLLQRFPEYEKLIVVG